MYLFFGLIVIFRLKQVEKNHFNASDRRVITSFLSSLFFSSSIMRVSSPLCCSVQLCSRVVGLGCSSLLMIFLMPREVKKHSANVLWAKSWLYLFSRLKHSNNMCCGVFSVKGLGPVVASA